MVLVVITVAVRDSLKPVDWFLIALVLVIVVGQTLWLIPRLDVRVRAIIDGEVLPRSHLHSVYAGAEFAKALALLLLGTWTAGTSDDPNSRRGVRARGVGHIQSRCPRCCYVHIGWFDKSSLCSSILRDSHGRFERT